MISLEEARDRVLAPCRPLPPRSVPLDEALGRVLAEAVVSTEPVPPFANTAMDGYAVRAADTAGAPVELRVVATLPAGADPAGIEVGPGDAVRIMTGAPIPAGADAIVMVELTSGRGDSVMIERAAETGDHIRAAGEDIGPGQEVFPAGTVLDAGHLGVLASIGLEAVTVYPPARVGVLSTGDELVEGGGALRPGQIRDSNRRSLLALVRQAGAEPVDLGLVADEEAAVEAAIDKGVATCDALITSGGVSMGDYDYVKAVLDRRTGGTGLAWMQVAIRPAKPLAFGVVDGRPVFGLPGNPVSSMVSFELFARPALRRLMGHSHPERPLVKAVADESFRRRPDGRLNFTRVVASLEADGRYHLRSAGGQASNLLRAMALANALALVPDGEGVDKGDELEVLLLSGLP